MKKVHTYFVLLIAMMAFTTVAGACGGGQSGSHSKGKCGVSATSGCSLKSQNGDVRSLKRAADILREEHPLLAARLENIGVEMNDGGNNHIH